MWDLLRRKESWVKVEDYALRKRKIRSLALESREKVLLKVQKRRIGDLLF